MGRATPDRTLSQIETLLADRGDVGLTLFRSQSGWIANIKTATEGFACGQRRATLPEAVAQVLGEEEPEDREWEDLI